MAKIVNLRRARKTAKREEKRAEVERRTGGAPAARKADARREAERHEGHRLDRDD